MIYKISPHPSLLKRGREKAEMTHSITLKAQVNYPAAELRGIKIQNLIAPVGDTLYSNV